MGRPGKYGMVGNTRNMLFDDCGIILVTQTLTLTPNINPNRTNPNPVVHILHIVDFRHFIIPSQKAFHGSD